jgi:hypothetical protein
MAVFFACVALVVIIAWAFSWYEAQRKKPVSLSIKWKDKNHG